MSCATRSVSRNRVLVDVTTTLRPVEAADAEHLFRWSLDAETRRLQAARRTPMTRGDAQRAVEAILAGNGTSHVAFMIEADGRTIGNCWLGHLDRENRSASLGIVIGERVDRDAGIGTEAMRQLVRYGAEELGLQRIELWVRADSQRAAHVYEKVGFQREGVRRRHLVWDGHPVDTILMAWLADDA